MNGKLDGHELAQKVAIDDAKSTLSDRVNSAIQGVQTVKEELNQLFLKEDFSFSAFVRFEEDRFIITLKENQLASARRSQATGEGSQK